MGKLSAEILNYFFEHGYEYDIDVNSPYSFCLPLGTPAWRTYLLVAVDEEKAEAYAECSLSCFTCAEEKYGKIRDFLNAYHQKKTLLSLFLEEEEQTVKGQARFRLHPGNCGPECVETVILIENEIKKIFETVREMKSRDLL